MSCGPLSITRETNSGSGWPSMQTPARLWVFTLEAGMKPQPANCGNRYHLSTANAQLHTRTFGQPMGLFYRPNDIKRWEKKQALTNYIERFNNTLRQRVSRLVRKTLSFSKSLENHIGAIWYFIHYYNASLLV